MPAAGELVVPADEGGIEAGEGTHVVGIAHDRRSPIPTHPACNLLKTQSLCLRTIVDQPRNPGLSVNAE